MPRANETCSILLEQQTCSLHSEAKSPITASGWVWFDYNGKRPWGYLIETVLDSNERSVNAEMAVKIDVTSFGNYSTVCKCTGYCEPLAEREVFPIAGELNWSDPAVDAEETTDM